MNNAGLNTKLQSITNNRMDFIVKTDISLSPRNAQTHQVHITKPVHMLHDGLWPRPCNGQRCV